MFKKLLSAILILSVLLSVASCKYRRSNKPYLDYSDNGNDGFVYHTERNQTETFIAFTSRSGRTLLYPMNEEKYNFYDPDGLCKVESGKAYTITYDIQFKTGGMGGTYVAYFLAVYDWNEVPINKALFDKGFAQSANGNMYLFNQEGCYIGPDYVVLLSEYGGYDVYDKEYGKRHFDHFDRVIHKLPVRDQVNTIDIQFNVMRNDDTTDEHIIDCIRNGDIKNKDFVLIDANYYGTNYSNYDTIERAAVPDTFHENTLCLYADNASKERTRRVIKREDMASKTADELGLEQDVYDKLHKHWAAISEDERLGKVYNYDILLLGGSLDRYPHVVYGPDFKLDLYESDYEIDTGNERRYQYVAVFIRSEFNNFLPQD
ncbi:MAG: hypothetical protein IKT10_02650 [Clostridiales bacterium]|nr:hypothetical protein [Clostridiales bacterium]